MRVVRREFYRVKRGDVYKIYPIGDTHIGASACDEDRLRELVRHIKNDDDAYWIGMGDYCDFITLKDWRSNPEVLAGWINTADLVDLAKVEKEYFLDIVNPIASKCLALVEGNHERAIRRHTERDVYREIVAAVKGAGGFKAEDQLGLGYYGWLRLIFYRARASKERCTTITLNIHHGLGRGRLAGGKALNMQRWLWTHEADIVLFGHTHNAGVQPEAVEGLSESDRLLTRTRVGAFTGTFLRGSVEGPSLYSEIAGYFPLPYGGVEIQLRPHSGMDQRGRIRMVYET